MRIIGTNKMHLMPAHTHEPHPDICLDVLHDVADVEWAVRVGQRRRHKQLAWRGTGGSHAHCIKFGKGETAILSARGMAVAPDRMSAFALRAAP